MALLPYEHHYIEVEVADRTPGVKQKARFLQLQATQQTDGQLTVRIRVRVDLYADAAGGYGELLAGKGLGSYEVVLIADNNSAVDPQTGAVRHMRTTETAEEWQALLEAQAEPLLLQGNWFEMLLNTQQVAIGPMLRQFIEQADQPPFSKFA